MHSQTFKLFAAVNTLMPSQIEKNIVSTIAYYNELDYPLTAFEVWKYLTVWNTETREKNSNTLGEIISALKSYTVRKVVEEFRGFYFLKGRKELVESRSSENKLASRKMKKLRKIIWLLRFIPFVRMIAATGRMAMKNANSQSDWDLFIAIKNGRIWTGRTLITIFLQLIGKRRYKKRVKDRICLNYFVTDESLKIDISERSREVSLFSASEYSFIIPLFGFSLFQKFKIRNAWIKKFKPNYEIPEISDHNRVSDGYFSKIIRKCGEMIFGFDLIENFLRKIEIEKIARNPKTHQLGSIIEATDKQLVFLPEPRGKEILEKCEKKLAELLAHF